MLNLNKVTVFFLLLTLICTDMALSQYVPSKERGDSKYRRKTNINGNQVNATVFNYGMAGREDGNSTYAVQTPFEWPKNTGQVYLAVCGIVVGGEVVDNQGETQHIVSRMHYQSSPDGKAWTFEPIPGYYNSRITEGFARSDDPNTWPDTWPDKVTDESDPGWPGSWNGYFGKNMFNADQELYFKSADNLYDRYANYYPDTTDLTRKGLGVVLEARFLAWSQILVQDAVFALFKIKNDGTEPLDKVGVTITWADFVGGDGGDDLSEFNLTYDIAWSRDADNKSTDFGSNPVGIIAGAFLETPGNSKDRIDNDGDGETGGPKVTEAMLVGEGDLELSDTRRYDGIDNNGNGLIDENTAHIAFQDQLGVSYADGIDQNLNAEEGSPVVTADMVTQAQNDTWKRWPANPETDAVQVGKIHLIMVEGDDVGKAFKDNIDNDGDGENDSPVITQDMINTAAGDNFNRYKVPGTDIILYDLKSEDLGKMYADGIDNDGDGAIDEYMDEGIDEMIDESRNNGIDDDGDWNSITDDLGLDGLGDTGDEGENDGVPTSGAQYGLPGEPNVDVTDVSETDQIGLTGSFYRPSSEWIETYTDNYVWFNFMVPGSYFDPADIQTADYNLFISSGLFPLAPGQTEPMSLAIILANGPGTDPDGAFRKQQILNKKVRAQETYNNDYQFANAPLTPTLKAVAGDKKVTLYWDDVAESSYDNYIANIGGVGADFEGYRIYRSSDPAFQDALVITNGQGSLQYKLPVKQFDVEDGIVGYDSVGLDGVHFYMGDDTGIQHSWTDSSVQNGFTYYYAITSYDFGFSAGQILPAECNINIKVASDGTIESLGSNVVAVVPEASAAGYVSPTLGTANLVKGYTTGKVAYEIVDPTEIKDGHVYYITFEDTTKKGASGKPDTLTTKNFTVTDSTSNVVLIDKSTNLETGAELPLIDGFRLKLTNESRVQVNTEKSVWNNSSVTPFVIQKYTSPRSSETQGQEKPNDYKVIIGDAGFGTSTAFTYNNKPYPAAPVNFKVFNITTNQFIDFAFLEFDNSGPSATGWFSSNGKSLQDRIVFLEKSGASENLVPTWWFYLDKATTGVEHVLPQAGDTANISLMKPFLSTDAFRLVSTAGKVDNEAAKTELKDIKVVPNPYLANAKWEPQNPYTSGRGPRSIHFTHLPAKCTIRIFTVSGELVKELEHESNMLDGSEEWDLLTKDNLSAAYGVYIYYVDAPGIGNVAGKFAIIK